MPTTQIERPTTGTVAVGGADPFGWLGRFAYRRRWLVLIATIVFVVGSVLAGMSVFDRLQSGGFEDPAADSSRAGELLASRFDAAPPNLVVLVDPVGDVRVDEPEAALAGQDLELRLRERPGVVEVLSPWSTGSPALISSDRTQALVLVRFEGGDSEVEELTASIAETPATQGADLEVSFGGGLVADREFNETITEDLARAESIAIPVTLVLLVLVFGSVVAALLPLLVAGIAIVGTFLALYLVTLATDVSIFSINLATAMGLGLAIDYSLFIVSRFREELGRGQTTEQAIVATMRTAGRTVAFSALTVAVSLAALLVFPLYFLRSFGYAGIAVVLIAASGALFSLPALLSVLGPRVDRFSVRPRRATTERQSGLWARLAHGVMRRPVAVGAPVAVLLAVLAVPFLGVEWGLPDDRALPPGNELRAVSDTVRNDFPGGAATTTSVVLPDGSPEDAATLAIAISGLDDVRQVETVTGSYVDGERVSPAGPASARYGDGAGTHVAVATDLEPLSAGSEDLVANIRALDAPGEVLVGGRAAELVDSKAAIFGLVPVALGIIAITTFVLLFLMTGSVLIPIKAIVLNLLSLGATFGAMVWIFQEGNGADLLNFTPIGALDTSIPILMFCIAFGLSMDYEVFLLSRIKEAYDATGDTTESVATGLQRTGRIMTAAAAVLAVTFIAFSTSGVTFIKLMGVGLTLAVLLDATLVRSLLVPAFMRLAGRGNWWAPAPLRRLHQRIGISESG